MYILITLLLTWINLTTGKICSIDNIGKYISECDYKGQREIIFYWKEKCSENSSISLPPIIKASDCNLFCKSGEIIDYSLNTNTLSCTLCPYGYFSYGGLRKITNFNEEILREFINNCYVIINDEMKTNEQCELFKLNSKDNQPTTLLAGGLKSNKDAMYSYELIYNIKLNTPGKIFFSFRKDTSRAYNYINGQFNFYVDYDLKYHDSSVEDELNIKNFSFNVNPGYHSFMWQYQVWADPSSNANYITNTMNFELIELTLDGFYGHSNTCQPCSNLNDNDTFYFPQCKECREFEFYDNLLNKCVKCGEDEYTIGKAYSKQDCIKIKPCNEDFFIQNHSGKCDSNIEDVTFKYDDAFICLKNHSDLNLSIKKEHCKDCGEGYFYLKNSESTESYTQCHNCGESKYLDKLTNNCLECPLGTSLIKMLTINGHSKDARSYFDKNECYGNMIYNHNSSTLSSDLLLNNLDKGCAGWVFRSHGIHSGFSNTNSTLKILKKKIKMNNSKNSTAFIHLNFNITKQQDDEEFLILINDDLKGVFTENNNYTEKYQLKNSDSEISFVYKSGNRLNSLINNYSVIITEIKIVGSNEGAGIKCSDCDSGAIIIIKDGKTICEPCEKGTKPNKLRDKCIKCEEFDSLIHISCLNCVSFTEGSDCSLSKIIHNKKAKLKFDLSDFSQQLSINCEEENEICYNTNTFLGPIRDHQNNDLFYLSYSQRSTIDVKDFSYKTESNFIIKGHIFGLFKSDSVLHDKQDHNENTKTLKNIGSQIMNVKLIPKMNEEVKNKINHAGLIPIFKKSGIMVEYSNGDFCMEKERFRSFLFLYCDKSSRDVTPRLVKKSGCVYFFEMNSYKICPICVRGETVCINEKRFVLFEETSTCRITNTTTVNDLIKPNNEIENILTFKEVLSNSDMKFYFDLNPLNQKQFYEGDYFYVNKFNETQPDELTYLTKGEKFEEQCSSIEKLDSIFIYIVFIVPFIYLVTGICTCIFYCKYRKMRNVYQRLRDERSTDNTVSSNNIPDNQLQIEMQNS